MDCIGRIHSERLKLDGRPVSRNFQLTVIEQALLYISAGLREPAAQTNAEEMQTACEEALEALAVLRTPPHPFP